MRLETFGHVATMGQTHHMDDLDVPAVDLGTTTALSDLQRERALARLAERLSGTVLTITAAEHRSQRRNRTAARRRLCDTLREAVAPEVVRRPTRPTAGSRRRRLERKRRRSETKRNRKHPTRD